MKEGNLSIRYNTEYLENYDVNDGVGWGICQWTFWSRKQVLLDYANSKGTSVGDMDTQLEFLYLELTIPNYSLTGGNIAKMFTDLKQSNDIAYMTELFMNVFENPNKDVAHLKERLQAANDIYKMFKR